jgi:hypothetical protein
VKKVVFEKDIVGAEKDANTSKQGKTLPPTQHGNNK